jgi:hypothetical protein
MSDQPIRVAPLRSVPIGEQIKCVERELAMRKRAYPRFIERGSMTKEKADAEQLAMGAVLQTLREIERSELLL